MEKKTFKYRIPALVAACCDLVILGTIVAFLVEEVVTGVQLWPVELSGKDFQTQNLTTIWLLLCLFGGYLASREAWAAIMFVKAAGQEMELKKARTWRNWMLAFTVTVLFWALLLLLYLGIWLHISVWVFVRSVMLYIARRFIEELEQSETTEGELQPIPNTSEQGVTNV